MTLANVVATSLAQKHRLHEDVGSLVYASFYRMIVESLELLDKTQMTLAKVVATPLAKKHVNPVMHARAKYVEMDYHFVRKKVARGQLLTQFVRSKDQLSDIHIKALSKQVFAEFCSKLGVTVPPLTSLRGNVEGS
ncbi:uncharacterized protein LOC125837738 [Solanum verrucosum]|uniref:uncharacterized protein LOC125837738 n=1 Tax=Solanum verrucosum TaxID=315347 RepID=UPI0020D0F1FB|nr:uncharacterized protein LOC125837738 [Solanum verrucosum]